MFSNGKIVEEGSHQELIAKKGLYYNLVTSQEAPSNNEEAVNFSVSETSKEFQNIPIEPIENSTQLKEVNFILFQKNKHNTTG